MYAIIETGGKQYNVHQGDVLRVEKLAANVGETVEVTRVLALGDVGEITVGTPYIEGAKVVLKVMEQGKGEKILVFKYKPKKKYRKLKGHRQPFSKVMIEDILGESGSLIGTESVTEPIAEDSDEPIAEASAEAATELIEEQTEEAETELIGEQAEEAATELIEELVEEAEAEGIDEQTEESVPSSATEPDTEL